MSLSNFCQRLKEMKCSKCKKCTPEKLHKYIRIASPIFLIFDAFFMVYSSIFSYYHRLFSLTNILFVALASYTVFLWAHSFKEPKMFSMITLATMIPVMGIFAAQLSFVGLIPMVASHISLALSFSVPITAFMYTRKVQVTLLPETAAAIEEDEEDLIAVPSVPATPVEYPVYVASVPSKVPQQVVPQVPRAVVPPPQVPQQVVPQAYPQVASQHIPLVQYTPLVQPPQVPVPAPSKWGTELDLLHEMAFHNDARSTQLLEQFNGNMRDVVETLLTERSQ